MLVMDRYTKEQRIEIVECWILSSKSMMQTIRLIDQKWGHKHHISETTVRKIVNRFYQVGSVLDAPKPTRLRNARNAETIAAVSKSVIEAPEMSIRHRSQQLGISTTSIHRILRLDLNCGTDNGAAKKRKGKPAAKPIKKAKKKDTSEEDEEEDSE